MSQLILNLACGIPIAIIVPFIVVGSQGWFNDVLNALFPVQVEESEKPKLHSMTGRGIEIKMKGDK